MYEKTENKWKEAGDDPFYKKVTTNERLIMAKTVNETFNQILMMAVLMFFTAHYWSSRRCRRAGKRPRPRWRRPAGAKHEAQSQVNSKQFFAAFYWTDANFESIKSVALKIKFM